MSTESELERPQPAAADSLARWAWPAMGLVLLAAFAAVSYLWWSARPPAEGDPAVIFARDMTAHHMQAVQMAVIVRDRSTDAELRQVALDIVLTQQAQIGQMEGWLDIWGLPFEGPQPPMSDHSLHGVDMPPNMGMASAEEMASLSSLSVPDAEIQFLKLMIRHHQGGIYMANLAHQRTPRPEVQHLAQATVISQQREIQYMQQLLTQRGVASP